MTALTLVVLAAGLGSRYGGLKQVDAVGPAGEVILDYAVWDAVRAGCGRVVVVTSAAMEAQFAGTIGARLARHVPVAYARQELGQVPPGFQVPEGRAKPWGTAHAVLAAKGLVDTPFAVINADDYYGPAGFAAVAAYLGSHDGTHWAAVGYRAENTLTDTGTVARGVLEVDESGQLTHVVERTAVAAGPTGARYREGDAWVDLPAGTLVSMNLWGLTPGFFDIAAAQFESFLTQTVPTDPLGAECFLPAVVEAARAARQADVAVLTTPDRWYGVTYREDKPRVVAALAGLHAAGVYPTPLWGEA